MCMKAQRDPYWNGLIRTQFTIAVTVISEALRLHAFFRNSMSGKSIRILIFMYEKIKLWSRPSSPFSRGPLYIYRRFRYFYIEFVTYICFISQFFPLSLIILPPYLFNSCLLRDCEKYFFVENKVVPLLRFHKWVNSKVA